MKHLLNLDARLARLLNYTGIEIIDVSANTQFVSAWPPGYDRTKPGQYGPTFDRVTVPGWCCTTSTPDKGAIVDLMVKYEVDVTWWQDAVIVGAVLGKVSTSHKEPFSFHPDKATALRVAVVKAVIQLLTYQKSLSHEPL